MKKDGLGGIFSVMSGKMKEGLEKAGGSAQEDKWWEVVPQGKLLAKPLDDEETPMLLMQQADVEQKMAAKNYEDVEHQQTKEQAREPCKGRLPSDT